MLKCDVFVTILAFRLFLGIFFKSISMKQQLYSLLICTGKKAGLFTEGFIKTKSWYKSYDFLSSLLGVSHCPKILAHIYHFNISCIKGKLHQFLHTKVWLQQACCVINVLRNGSVWVGLAWDYTHKPRTWQIFRWWFCFFNNFDNLLFLSCIILFN